MATCNILITRRFLPDDLDYIRAGLDRQIPGRYELFIPNDYSEDSLIELAEKADVFLGPFVTPGMLSQAKNLRLIQVPWTGIDNFNFEAVKGSSVTVCNTHSNADAVAELGVSLLLDLMKKVSYHDRKMRNGDWNRTQIPLDLSSRMLSKQKVCILGYGNIGCRVAKILQAFGSTVLAVDKTPNVSAHIIPPDQLTFAVSEADVVISTLPLTESTHGMINKSVIDKMKDGVQIVNISRAGVMDEDAIYTGLKSGKIGGFAADVWWNAPPRGESTGYPSKYEDICSFENVVMSPHRAGYIQGSLPHLDGAIDNLVSFCLGTELHNIVNINDQF